MRSPLFKSAFFTLVFVAAVDLMAIALHLFYTISWFDMVMHFLGGFFISISALTILTYSRNNFPYGKFLLYGVIAAVVIGLCWEVFELYFGITYFYSPDYVGDNGMDITMDIFGALVAVWYSYFKILNLKS